MFTQRGTRVRASVLLQMSSADGSSLLMRLMLQAIAPLDGQFEGRRGLAEGGGAWGSCAYAVPAWEVARCWCGRTTSASVKPREAAVRRVESVPMPSATPRPMSTARASTIA